MFKHMAAVAFITGLVGMIAAPPAGAESQVINAVIGNTVSMTTAPTASINNWNLATIGENSTSGGSMTIQSNVPYTVTLQSDKATMTEYVTATSSYDTSDPKALTNPLVVVPTLTGGAGVPVPSLSVGTSAAPIATGTGLTTDSYSLQLTQTTTVADEPLAAGRTYHMELTYTASETL